MTTIVSGSSITFNDNTTQNTSAYGGGFAFRNRIINGDCRIDQRNAGASVTVANSGQFAVDRTQSVATLSSKFSMQQNAGSVTPPAGFTNYLGATSLSAYSITSTDVFGLRQIIEGFNVADLGWGTANAKTITISFWVRSSLTGTFGLGLGNDGFSRAYAESYTINSANTWEYKTLTIPGDTSGTWLTNNGVGLNVTFGLGYGSSYLGTAGVWNAGSYFMPTGATSVVGTNGATFYITGVQLEKGSTATSFDYRPYSAELAMCQRYYFRATGTGRLNMGLSINTTNADGSLPFPTTMRTAPTALEQSGTASHYSVYTAAAANSCTSVPVFVEANINSGFYRLPTGAAQTTGQSVLMGINNASGYLGWSAEL